MVTAFVTVAFSYDDKPAVNSQDELIVATSPICPVGPSRSAPPRRSERHPSSSGEGSSFHNLNPGSNG